MGVQHISMLSGTSSESPLLNVTLNGERRVACNILCRKVEEMFKSKRGERREEKGDTNFKTQNFDAFFHRSLSLTDTWKAASPLEDLSACPNKPGAA